jgi:hypothetical protein
MRFCLLLLLILSPLAQAQKTLGPETFQVHIRPVLNGILGDFYQMISHFPDFPKEIIPLIQELDKLTVDKEIMRESCPRIITAKCSVNIKNIRRKLLDIKAHSLNLMAEQKMASSLHLSTLSGLRLINQFDLKLEEIKGYLDNTSFLQTANIPQKRETYFVLKQLDEMNTYVSLALVEYIPFAYKSDFRHFYFNFVQPVQVQLSKNKNYVFLNRNVNSLNFALNLLNMNLTKRNKKTPEGMAPYLSVIHNRWNSILRYYF